MFRLSPTVGALPDSGVTAEYLRNKASEAGAVIDYRDWQIPPATLSRFKLWFVIRHSPLKGCHITSGATLSWRKHLRGGRETTDVSRC